MFPKEDHDQCPVEPGAMVRAVQGLGGWVLEPSKRTICERAEEQMNVTVC